MRNIFLALAAAGGLAMAGLTPAEAVGSRYPFCLQGNDSPGLSNCTFTSYQQCQATASARRANQTKRFRADEIAIHPDRKTKSDD